MPGIDQKSWVWKRLTIPPQILLLGTGSTVSKMQALITGLMNWR